MFGFNRKKKDTDKVNTPSMTLSDIVRGIQHSVASAIQTASDHYLRILDQYFEEKDDDSGKYKAKSVEIELDKDHVINVPLISLVSPKSLNIDTFKVKTALKVDQSEIKKATKLEGYDDVTRGSYSVSFGNEKAGSSIRNSESLMQVEITFKAGEPSEGMMKIIDHYTNNINPISNEKLEQIRKQMDSNS